MRRLTPVFAAVALAALSGPRARAQDVATPPGPRPPIDAPKSPDAVASTAGPSVAGPEVVPGATPAPSPGPKVAEKGKDKLSAADLGGRPYAIRAWVVASPQARLDGPGRSILLSAWQTLVRRFVGPPWQLEVAEGAGPLLGGDLGAVQADTIAAAAPGRDKAWLIVVEPDGGDGFVFSGREFDATTLRLGQIVRRRAAYPSDAPRVLLNLALEMFSPYAEIGEQAGGGVKITVQGGALPAADPIGRVVVKGSTFRLIRLTYDLKGVVGGVIARSKTGVPLIKDVPHSYLRVEEVEGPVARCAIVSGVRDPLTKRALRSRVVALGIRAEAIPTRFRFVVPPEKPTDPTQRRSSAPPKPAAGFVLTARDLPDGTPHEVGITDREGRVVLPAGFASHLVVVRLQAGSNEPLVDFPVMPGEIPDEQVIPIRPKPEAVALETAINALRDELVDLVGIRKRLESRIKARLDSSRWDEARDLVAQYRKLPARKEFDERLAKLKQQAIDDQHALKRPILTKTAQGLLADAQALADRFLKTDEIEELEDTLKEHGGTATAAAAPQPAPAPPPVPTPAPTTPPPAAATGASPTTPAGADRPLDVPNLFTIASPGGGFAWKDVRTFEEGGFKNRLFACTNPATNAQIVLTVQQRPAPDDGMRSTALKAHYNGMVEALRKGGFKDLQGGPPSLTPPIPELAIFGIAGTAPNGKKIYFTVGTIFKKNTYLLQVISNSPEEGERLFQVVQSLKEKT